MQPKILKPDPGELSASGRGKPSSKAKYEITVQTSNLRGAGTEAKVFLEVHGKKATVGPLALENAPDNFQRGKMDVFLTEAQDVGAVSKIRIWIDGGRQAVVWNLDSIQLKVGAFFQA